MEVTIMNSLKKNSLFFSAISILFLSISTLFANQELLFKGVKESNLHIVKQAIDQGADVTKPGEQGLSALHWAVFYGNEQIVDCLIKEIKYWRKSVQTPARSITANKCVWGKMLTLQHEKPVNSAVFSPNGAKILTVSSNNTVTLWDLKGNTIATIKHNACHGDGWIKSAVFNPDGNKVLTYTEGVEIGNQGKRRRGGKGRHHTYTAVMWNLKGDRCATFTLYLALMVTKSLLVQCLLLFSGNY